MGRTLIIFFCFFQISLLAQTGMQTPVKVTGDHLHYLNLEDTIFLTVGAYEEKFTQHYLAPGQTVYQIALFYGLKLNQLYDYNPGLKSKTLNIGDAINIPIPNKAIKRYKSGEVFDYEHVPIYYTIKKGETLYRVAKTLFRMPVDTLKARNGLVSDVVKVNQQLLVGWLSVYGIEAHLQKVQNNTINEANRKLRDTYYNRSLSRKEYANKGVAVWQKNSPMKTGTYALHRKAPLNSLISVTNPMNNRTVYAKVIGRIPSRAYGSDVETIITPYLADLLDAKDPRFFVEVKYLK